MNAKEADGLWTAAAAVLERLTAGGYEAYYVGGCVRDRLLGQPVHDIDIATSAKPEQVMALFERTIPTGLQHGTVTVLDAGVPFEVTTYRSESEYVGFRRPKSVQYITELTEDLRRRDFTINAMAMDAAGRLADPFGGERDLRAGLLRCVGAPEQRFAEDALRMLRCIRFACRFGLSVDEATWAAVLEHGPKLVHVAMERVSAELDKTLDGPDPRRGVALLAGSGLYRYWKEPAPVADEAWQRLARPVVAAGSGGAEALPPLERLPAGAARWAALWALLGAGSADAVVAMERLRFSRDKQRAVRAVLAFGEELALAGFGGASGEAGGGEVGEMAGAAAARDSAEAAELNRERWTAATLRHGREAAGVWLELAQLDARLAIGWAAAGRWSLLQPWLQQASQWLQQIAVAERELLRIDGNALAAAAGRKPGPWLRASIDELWLAAALGRVDNTPEALMAAFRQRQTASQPPESRGGPAAGEGGAT